MENQIVSANNNGFDKFNNAPARSSLPQNTTVIVENNGINEKSTSNVFFIIVIIALVGLVLGAIGMGIYYVVQGIKKKRQQRPPPPPQQQPQQQQPMADVPQQPPQQHDVQPVVEEPIFQGPLVEGPVTAYPIIEGPPLTWWQPDKPTPGAQRPEKPKPAPKPEKKPEPKPEKKPEPKPEKKPESSKCEPGNGSQSEYVRRVQVNGKWVCPSGYTDTNCHWDDGQVLGEKQCRRPKVAPTPAPAPPSGPAPTGVLQLGVPPLEKSGAPWNVNMVQKNSLAKISVSGDTLQVVYPAMCGGEQNPKKKCGSGAGINLRASPSCCFPATAMQFGYSVYFPADFNFQNSGKCPGMWIGEPKASGGNWLPKGGSVRLMWRTSPGGKDPYFIGYVYIPTEVGGSQQAAVAKQNISDAHQSGGGRTGLDLWQRSKGSGASPFPIKIGSWNDVVLTVGLNALGQSDGYITLQVNGKSQTYRNMTWRTSDLKLNGIMIASWFGGSDQKKYGSPKDETASFRNFWLKKLA